MTSIAESVRSQNPPKRTHWAQPDVGNTCVFVQQKISLHLQPIRPLVARKSWTSEFTPCTSVTDHTKVPVVSVFPLLTGQKALQLATPNKQIHAHTTATDYLNTYFSVIATHFCTRINRDWYHYHLITLYFCYLSLLILHVFIYLYCIVAAMWRLRNQA